MKMKYQVSFIFLMAVPWTQPNATLSLRNTGNIKRHQRAGRSIHMTGIVSCGLRALNKLLADTRELPATDMAYRDFVKPGGYNRALLDFHAVTKWTRKYAGSKADTVAAEVGDRFIFLRSRGENGRPEIEIMKMKTGRTIERQLTGDRIDRITYKD